MIDDISYIPDTISILSKVKEQQFQEENSLSRIIREQALNYSQEIPDQDIEFHNQNHHQNKRQETTKKDGRNFDVTRKQGDKANRGKEGNLYQGYSQGLQKLPAGKEKRDKITRDRSPEEPIRATERKAKLLHFDDFQNQNVASSSKKEKRAPKLKLDEQKTKKIEFQDINRNNQQQQKPKKIEHTKIKQNIEYLGIEQSKQGILQLCSKESSDMQFQQREVNIFVHKIQSNYNLLMGQVREMMTMNRWEYIQIEKVQVRKLISKIQGEIRKYKIGFRGLTQSCDSFSKNKSKIKLLDNPEGRSVNKIKGTNQVSKIQSHKSKDKAYEKSYKLSIDYGFDALSPQMSKSSLQESSINEKVKALQEQIDRKRYKSNKLTSQYNQLAVQYNQLKQSSSNYANNHRHELVTTPSMINRGKILKEKVTFLKNQIKETKLYYANRIKRLKNQNTLLGNQSKYTEKQIDDIKRCIRNIEKSSKQQSQQKNSSNNQKHQIYVFDEKANPVEYGQPSKITNTTKGMSSNLLTVDIACAKSIKSLQSIHSKQSFGEVISQKSTKTESERNQEYQIVSKPKLKINSPHSPAISTGNAKLYSIITKRKKENQLRLGVNSADSRNKKQSSLDVAFKELQQKYGVKEAENRNEYYHI